MPYQSNPVLRHIHTALESRKVPMNRFNLALGLSLWSIGLSSTISGALDKLLVLQKLVPEGIAHSGGYLIVAGLVLMIFGSFFVALAFPKKAS